MEITNTFAAKLFGAVVAVAMVFTLAAPSANAQTADELQAMINDLLAQVAALQGQVGGGGSAGAGVCPYTWTRSLSNGSTGMDVMKLQQFLNSDAETRVAATGVGSAGQETEYYGSLTGAAVAKFQSKYFTDILAPLGLVSPTTYFGPSTMAKANMLCASGGMMDDDMMDDDMDDDANDDANDDDGELEGGAGSVETYDLTSGLSGEEVGEGEDDVEVAGLEIEVSDSSDIEITAVRLDFDQGTADNDFDDYASEVSVWLGGEEFGRVDADRFNDDNNYARTVSLDRGAIIRSDDTDDLVVAVSGANAIDGTDVTETWTVDFTSLRFRDAQDVTISEDPGTAATTFSFESFASASNVELKVKKDDDDINDARTIQVDDNDDTDGVELLSFTIEAEGDSDLTIDDLSVDFTSVGAGVGEIINSATLVIDGDEMDSTSVSSTTMTTRTINFTNFGFELGAGDTVSAVIEVDANDLGGGFTAGDTLAADVNPDDAGWDVEDEQGDDLAASDKSGTAASDAHTFYADGIQVEEKSVSTASNAGDNADDDYVTLTIKFDVTAYGETAWIQNAVDQTTGTSTSSTTPTNAVGVHVQSSDTDLTVARLSSVLSSTADEGTNAFEVSDGETETFTLITTVSNASSSLLDGANVRAILAGVGFADTDSATSDQMFTSNVTDIKTDYAFISN